MSIGLHTSPLRRHALWLSVASALLCASLAHAQDTTTGSTQDKNTKQLQQVVVTGTRSTTRTVDDSLAPIDVLTPKDLASTGAGDLATALNRLLPSLDFPHPAINDGNDALRPATLRGLSPDDVLVLVNGKRYHTSSLVNYNESVGRGSAPVDLNSIPMAAIDHIEVLRDGASAQYGSDAIAGVINIILKGAPGAGKNSVDVYGGVMDVGDGANNGVEGSVAIPLGGELGKAPGWARFSWNYQSVMNTNRAENTDPTFNYPPRDFINNPYPPPTPYQRYGEPAEKVLQGVLNMEYNLGGGVQLYGNLIMGKRDVTSNGYWRMWNNPDRNVTAVYPDGFLPHIVNPTRDYQGTLGLKGQAWGWNWDLSGTYGENNLAFDITNSINTNLYHSTGSSPTSFFSGRYATKLGVLNFDASREFNPSFLKNGMTVAWGVEYKKDEYDVGAGEPASYYFNPATLDPSGNVYPGGSQVWPGITPDLAGSFSRHNYAAYVDLESDITDKFSAGAAARYENYSGGVGSVVSGKLSARYQITDTFALRATASNGFRAPSMAQVNYSSTVTLVSNGQLVQVGTLRPDNPLAIAYGAKPLTPEKSSNFSVGAVFTPLSQLNATLDIYQIRIWHQILYSDPLTNTNPNFPQIAQLQFFVNGGDTRTRGADLVVNYNQTLGDWGQLNNGISANYNQVHIESITNPALLGPYNQGLLTKGTPRTKYLLYTDWQKSGWNVHADLTRYGSVTDVSDADIGLVGQKFPARWLLNLSLNYSLEHWIFAAGVDNVTNQYPAKVNLTNNGGYEDRGNGLQYSALSPFGFDGRYWYGKVTYRW
jgi:iron complex outermembrane receptor protein